MKYKYFTVALALGSVILTGCVSNQTEQVNKKDIQKILAEMQNSPSAKFIAAENLRDAKAMFAIAQDIAKKNPEAGQKMYKRCAFVVAMQQNKTLFNEIASLNSEAKKYGFMIQKGNVPSMLPQLVKVNSVAEAAEVGVGMQPVWGVFIADCYENLTKENAEVIAANVNSARKGFSAEDLLAAAKDLSAYKTKSEVPAQLKVQTIVREAVNLAEVANDAKTMQAIIDFCKEKSILPAKEQKELVSVLKSMGKTRARYVNVSYKNGVSGRRYRKNGWNVSNIRLSDGSVISVRDDGSYSEKMSLLKTVLRRSSNLRRFLASCYNNATGKSTTLDGLARFFYTCLEENAEKNGLSFSVNLQILIALGEGAANPSSRYVLVHPDGKTATF